jgi:hypothetical protein
LGLEQTPEMKDQYRALRGPGRELSPAEKAEGIQTALGCVELGIGAWWTAQSMGIGGLLGGGALMAHGGANCFHKESPVAMVIRETGNAVREGQGIKVDTPEKARIVAENDAMLEAAVTNVAVGIGIGSPNASPVPIRTDGPAVARLPKPPTVNLVKDAFEAGRQHEARRLAARGVAPNNNVWVPTEAETETATFQAMVGPAKRTKGGRLIGIKFDSTEGGNLEVKGGDSELGSRYQLRLEVYRSVTTQTPLAIDTTRPVNPQFKDWLDFWGVDVTKPK